MLVLTSARAIRFAATCPHPPGPPESRLLHYVALLEADPIAWLFVVQVGDTLADLAALRGYPFAEPIVRARAQVEDPRCRGQPGSRRSKGALQ